MPREAREARGRQLRPAILPSGPREGDADGADAL